ncbi:MAG: DNA recombination protein RmuC [Ignavibacteriaceae bacterium]|nr:DNA recombination protein RmuC [Ignavibacterium sp.]MCC6254202.1 DNA recombination protein RmuC [Ignavibacteriaceae bacterium]HRN25835.1 DNA recombination protein RmuC [Ignavibacteriaceae bacterium]HRP91430.1 DNA recombination protein RmuC [Ignavibacteriaceae bacterium]HRQ53449.1 DNA recombination protein RmuC [Ignavibacteriaceae bacterium]
MEIIYLIIGLVIGFVIAFLFFKTKKTIPIEEANKLNELINSLKVEAGSLSKHINLLEDDKLSLQSDLKIEREKSEKLNAENSSLKSDFTNLQTKLAEQKGEVEKLQDKFTTEFENLANKIFEEKGNKFSEQNKEKLSEILNPLKEKISDFERKVDETNKENIKGNASLKEQLQSLKEMNQQITQEAKNLTTALKGQSKTQGNWGEFILESILEKSGLVKGREYVVQESITAESGRRFQPDVIINLPENKSIIIDSKVSLIGYEKFISEEDEHQKQLGLREHINSIRAHIKNLSGKNYQNLYQIESLDFVLMFMPIEPAFAYAVQNDPSIFTDAFEQNIVIVSPSTLLATLRTISSIWRQENQNKNAMEIARQAGTLYDKFVNFYNDLLDVGKRLDSAKDSYENAMKKIHDGRGNLISGVEKMKQLGAKASKSLPPAALNRADIDDDNLLNN